MEHEVTCTCGNVLTVSEGMLNSSTLCSCGRTVSAPSLPDSRTQAITSAVPPSVPELRLADEPQFKPNPTVEIISPKQAFLRIERGTQPGRRAAVMVGLTSEAIWIQETWRLREVSLQSLVIERRQNGEELALNPGSEPASEKLTLTFPSTAQAGRWCAEVQERQQQLAPDAPQDDRRQPEGVALVRQVPPVAHVVLGQVECTGPSQWAADQGLQLRAGIRGADAVIEVCRQKVPGVSGGRHVTGLAVRVEDADARNRLRMKWYDEEVCSLVNRLLLLLVIQGALLFLVSAFWSSTSGLQTPTGETREELLASAGLALGVVCAWPLVLVALLRVFRWPQLLRITGLVTLTATTGRGLTICLAHLLAVLTSGARLAESKIWLLFDPVDWIFLIAGAVLCVRAWRLAGNARQILPEDMQAAPASRKAWSRGLLAATGVYVLVLLGLVGISRYQASDYEQEALLAMNEGAAQANKGDLGSAEGSFQRARRIWESLTRRNSAPSVYRANLAMTLYNLGWLREKQGRANEAEELYARAVTLADELAGDPKVDDASFKLSIASARQALTDLRAGKSSKQLEEKEQAATRKYEEAQVKAQKGAGEAEQLYQEAITLWEEVFPLATNEDYRKSAVARLASAHLQLGELQQQLGKRSAAEATLKKAIEYGEQAVALEPDRPVRKHNLELARQKLEGLREQAHEEEVTRLWKAERFADARALYRRNIEEQEQQVRWGKDREAAVRRLASRLNRFAWFLAHCPDGQVRDTKGALKHIRRATELQPDAGEHWYTLAMVQYRNADWRDSLTSLEKVKTREGGLDASGWFLSAMDLHQLKQKKEAQAALRKGVEWIDERTRQGEENAILRFQFEMMRPALEALRREAEKLIEGKDPADQGVG
jgi:tetratricopeptide (TPR) repeat protein